jgi:hypothetical protein
MSPQQRLLPQIEGHRMSKRIEQSRRHGHWDPRYAAKAPASQDDRVSVVTPRNPPPRDEERSTPKRTTVAFRYELCDNNGSYTGTFVTEIERWQIGDVFTTGDGRTLRITAITAPERSNNRPAYTDRWNVEAVQPQSS